MSSFFATRKSSQISSLALSAVLSTGLMLSACSKKDETTIKSAVSQSALKVDARTVSDSDAEKALTAFALNNSGDGIVKWTSREGEKGNYVFEGLTIQADGSDGPVSIERLELTGAHMDNDAASFDKAVLNGLSFETDGNTGSMAKLTLVNPSEDLTNLLAAGFNGADESGSDKDISFDALDIQTLSFAAEDANMKMGSLYLGKNGEGDDATGNMSMRNMVISSSDDDMPVNMTLGSIDVVDFNMAKYKPLVDSMKDGAMMGESAILQNMQSINSLDPDFKSFSLRDFDADIEGVKIDLDSIEAKSTVKGDTTTVVQDMSPLTITPPAESDDPQMQQFKEALSAMNYDELVFTSHQKSVMNKATDSVKLEDSYIEMKDGFRLSFDFDGSGISEFQKKQMEMTVSDNPSTAMEMMGALDIRHAGFQLEDKSIIDRAFEFAALQQGGSAGTLKMQAKAATGMMMMMAQDDAQREFLGELSGALGEFIDNGGTLAFDMKPTEGFNLSEVMNGAQSGQIDIESMGLTVSHK